MISFILNIPYTLVGIAVAIISLPVRIKYNNYPRAFVINVQKFWWAVGYLKGGRAMTIGHVILLGSNLEERDLEHELVHVSQYERIPLFFPFLYYLELFKKGYRNNKYEEEAYRRAQNVYKER